ncbi:MAG: hypothetical protein LBT57_02730 [Puniceicoccales bacterium]|nr:hypothetical protein [Puniceicoccales bacterium]
MAELTLILLSQEVYRERMFRWEVLSQSHGYTVAFARRHRRHDIPDVFDHIHAQSREAGSSNILFIDHYDIERRFPSLKQHYPLFLHSSQWFQFLKHYLPPACAIDADVFAFIQVSSARFQDEARSAAVLLKLLYRFAQLEGLPVRQNWLLPHREAEELRQILHQPLAAISADQASRLGPITTHLRQWILQHSDHAAIPFSSGP